MATLTETQKRYVVERLACFDTPSEVSDAFREDFGIDLSRQQIWYYDASKLHNRTKLAGDLVTLFDETRRKFREEIEGIPIANKAYRLRRLQRIVRRAGRNHVLEMDALEQAAKEVGDAYTNRREVTGKGGGPLTHAHLSLSDEDLDGATVEQLVDAYFSFDQGE